MIRIVADGFKHNFYKNKYKYILIIADSQLQSGREQLRYYNYNIKVANNYIASCFLSEFLK